MKLRTRILLGYGLAMALLAAVLVIAVAALVPLGDATDAILHENYRSIAAANDMLDVLWREQTHLMLPTDDAESRKLRECDAAFLAAMTRTEDNITISGEDRIIADIRSLYAEWRDGLYSPRPADKEVAARMSDPGPAAARMNTLEVGARLRERLLALRKANRDHMYDASNQASTMARKAIWLVALPGFAGLVLILLFSIVLSNRLVHPIRAMADAARMIGGGQLDVRLTEERRDELGALAMEFNHMAIELKRFRDMNIDEVITARRKSEAVLSSIDDGIILIDRDLRVDEVNPAALQLLRRPPAAAHGGPSLELFLPVPEVLEAVTTAFGGNAVHLSADEQRIFEVPGGGTPRFCQYSVDLIHRSEQQPGGAVLVLRDVTRLKEVERLKTEFVMAASHELRTPLTSIGMSIELLAENLARMVSPKDRALIDTAREEIARLSTLVEDLLDLAKIESGRIEMQFEPTRLPLLFERISSIFSSQCSEKGVQILFEAPEDIPEAQADASKIAWVLTNLVSNALRYVSSGGTILVSARSFGVRAAGGTLHISVKDDGPGIPAEYQSMIFERFRQVPGRISSGSGLGLAISKEIVKAHGGTIWVESNSGSGSTFTFTLPAAA
jgi:two-component system, NtrC family, sensor histidine kinase KinB